MQIALRDLSSKKRIDLLFLYGHNFSFVNIGYNIIYH